MKALVDSSGKVMVGSDGKVATDDCPENCCGPPIETLTTQCATIDAGGGKEGWYGFIGDEGADPPDTFKPTVYSSYSITLHREEIGYDTIDELGTLGDPFTDCGTDFTLGISVNAGFRTCDGCGPGVDFGPPWQSVIFSVAADGTSYAIDRGEGANHCERTYGARDNDDGTVTPIWTSPDSNFSCCEFGVGCDAPDGGEAVSDTEFDVNCDFRPYPYTVENITIATTTLDDIVSTGELIGDVYSRIPSVYPDFATAFCPFGLNSEYTLWMFNIGDELGLSVHRSQFRFVHDSAVTVIHWQEALYNYLKVGGDLVIDGPYYTDRSYRVKGVGITSGTSVCDAVRFPDGVVPCAATGELCDEGFQCTPAFTLFEPETNGRIEIVNVTADR